MAEPKDVRPKGSILYKILIVVLGAMLVASIIYPKQLKEAEALNREIGRERMSQILAAELQFQRFEGRYTDSLDVVLNFVRTDTAYAAYVDSTISRRLNQVIEHLGEFKQTEEFILSNIPNATDSVMIDSLSNLQTDLKTQARDLAGTVEFVHDRMKNLPNMPLDWLKTAFLVVDSKQFTLKMDIVRNLINSGQLQEAEKAAQEVINVIDNVTQQFQTVAAETKEFTDTGLDSMRYCPTVREPYHLVYVDTSAFKFINIYCPIDSADIARVKQDFVKSTFGGLKLENHGKIEAGEKSWETGQQSL